MATKKSATKTKSPAKSSSTSKKKTGGFARAKDYIGNFITNLRKDTKAGKKEATKAVKKGVAKAEEKVKSATQKAKTEVKKVVPAAKKAVKKAVKSAATNKKAAVKKVDKATAGVKAAVKKAAQSPTGKKITKAVSKDTKKKPVSAGKTDKEVNTTKAPVAKRDIATKVAAPEIEITTPIISHGDDLHLIPVTGEINPAGTHDSKIHEQAFKHRSETLMHQENMRAKTAMATRKNIKAQFRNFRQS